MPLRWRRWVSIFVGGMIGGGLRIGLAELLPAGDGWPWATFTANVSGALLLGYLLSRFLQAGARTTVAIPLVGIGILGSYTTFSLFSMEIWTLAESGHGPLAAVYAMTSIGAGLAAAMIGIRSAERRS